jgi:hypothetical protein
MISVNITGDAEVRAMLAQIDAIGKSQALALTAVDVEAYVRQEADKHTKTGALIQSVFSRKESDSAYRVGHDLQRAPHALFVHWGAKPHVIVPNKKKALRWASGDRFIFARMVNHPGNKEDTWMLRAADLVPRLFVQHVEALLRKV